jgi:hypothetical protein
MDVAIGLRHYEAESHGFVHKGHFTKIASPIGDNS